MKRRSLFMALVVAVAGAAIVPSSASAHSTSRIDSVRFVILAGAQYVTIDAFQPESSRPYVCAAHFRAPDPSRPWDQGSYVTDCAFGEVSIDPALGMATVRATVPTADTLVGDFDIDTTHIGGAPSTRHQLLDDASQVHSPRGTTQFFCFDMGTYQYTAFVGREALTQGTVVWGGTTLGQPDWAEIYRRIDARGALINC